MGQSRGHNIGSSDESFRKLFGRVDFLNIGHVCHDISNDGYLLGGTVSYAALIARNLGVQPGIITSHGDDFQFLDRFKDLQIPLWNSTSEFTTSFENRYEGGNRTQYLITQASKVQVPNDIVHLEQLNIIQLGLIADEVDLPTLQQLPKDCLKGASIQGWLRDRDRSHKVFTKRPDLMMFQYLDIAFMSIEDLGAHQDLLPEIIDIVPIVVVTKGYQGALVYKDGKRFAYGAYPCEEVDPTGAGDVFSTTFMLAFRDSTDLDDAVAFAHSAASLSIEENGLDNLPTIDKIEYRKLIYKNKFIKKISS